MTKFGISEFSDKPTNYSNLDMIISVGYRVKSQNGILFRKWATSVLKDYMLKGYAVNQINKLRFNEESALFAVERDKGLESIIGNIYQSFAGQNIYKSIEEKSANYLYLIVKKSLLFYS